MDVKSLRTWGIAVSAAAIASLLTFAVTACEQQTVGPTSEQTTVTELEGDAQALASTEQAPSDDVVFETAEAPPPPVRGGTMIGFLVRFQGTGPMARAQALAARGQEAQAERAIETQLARQAAFRGLCFDRFTVGAAEVVLRTCAAVPQTEHASASARWLARLNAMPGVTYADANAAVTQDRTP